MKVLEYIIRALDKTADGTKSAIDRARTSASAIMHQMANIKAGWDMATGAIATGAKAVWSAVKEAFKFESLTVQFSVLMGSMDKAKARMAELADFAAKTPFSMEDAVVASRQLHVFSNGALGATGSLKLIGDAAAAVGGDMKEVSFWVGRAYSMIKGGQPFGEAAMRLQEMGIITPEVRTKMEELQAAGASNAEVWAVLEARLGTFSGGMEQLAKSGNGLISTLNDNWTAAIRTFGQAFVDTSKDGIMTLSDALDKLVSDGTINVWAARAVKALEMVKTAAGWTASAVKFIYDKSGLSDVVGTVRGVSRAAGALAGGGGISGAATAYMSGKATGYYGGKILGALGDPGGGIALNKRMEDEEKKADDAIRAKALAKAAEKAKTEAEKKQTDKDEKDKIAADLKRAQDEVDKKRKLEIAKKEEEERQKAAQKEADERDKLAKKLIEDEHKARVENIREEAQISAQSEANARDRLSRANSAAQQAWGWYRDPESFKRQLAEEKANAAAEKQYAKDFDKLNDRSDWRTTKRLTDSEESVRRVALAREEQDRAQQALIAIEKNTAGLESMLKRLLTSK